jgi:hypothetical protein
MGMLQARLTTMLFWCAAWSAATAQTPTIVRGVVRDSASGRPVGGAIVELTGATFRASVRAEQQGTFEFARVSSGTYRVSVRRIGFVEAVRQIDVGSKPVELTILLRPTSPELDTVRVHASLTGISGIVGTAVGLHPLAAATVQIIGANQTTSTDSAGRFLVPLKKPGTYVVRIRRDGFAERFFSVQVPANHVVETGALLDSSDASGRTASAAAWADFDERLRWLGGNGGAVIPSSELHRYAGGMASDAALASPSLLEKGLRFGPTLCLFVDGVPKPGWTLDAIPVEQIETIEAYTSTGDVTTTLAKAWPPGARCGETTSIRPPPTLAERRSMIAIASVWLKPH